MQERTANEKSAALKVRNGSAVLQRVPPHAEKRASLSPLERSGSGKRPLEKSDDHKGPDTLLRQLSGPRNNMGVAKTKSAAAEVRHVFSCRSP